MRRLYGLLIICMILFSMGCKTRTGNSYILDEDGNLHKVGGTEQKTDSVIEDEEVTPSVQPKSEQIIKLSAEEIYEKSISSVVEIVAEAPFSTSTGTGFFYDDKGTVITNYHVIEGCQSAEIIISSGESHKVTAVLGYNKDRDIAILSTSCENSEPLTFRTTAVRTGEKVYVLGSSLGLTGTLSDGIVSAINREVEGNVYIQTSAPISQGNSGGPLIDECGNVIGIVCASFVDGQNLNLAIPIEQVYTISLNKKIALDKLFKREVEWISDYRFLYYEDEKSYVLLFQLSDKDRVPLSASGTVKIRIINDNNELLYSREHSFSAFNFKKWINKDEDELYLANIYISPQNIIHGTTERGKVYFEVEGSDFSFDECTVITYDLPTKKYDK